jgi:hypothetical protein
MNVDQLTEIAFAVASKLEPSYNVDVFDVTDSNISFQDEHGLFRLCVLYLNNGNDQSLKKQIEFILKSRSQACNKKHTRMNRAYP